MWCCLYDEAFHRIYTSINAIYKAVKHETVCIWLTFFALQEKDGTLLKVRTFNLDCCLHLDAFPV